jgi:hypothetical protein
MVILCIVSLNGSHCYFFVLVAEFDILEYLCETYSVGRFFFFYVYWKLSVGRTLIHFRCLISVMSVLPLNRNYHKMDNN